MDISVGRHVTKVNKHAANMGDTQIGSVRERKRSAKSPLESITTRRKIEQVSRETLFDNKSLADSNKSDKIKDRLRSSGRERRHDGGRGLEHDTNMESHMRGMVASINNLEQLYSKLDIKVKKIQVDVSKRLQKFNGENVSKFTRLEQIQLEIDGKVNEYLLQIDRQNAKIEHLEIELKNSGIERLREVVFQLEKRQEELEEKLSQQSDARGPGMEDFRDVLVGLSKKIEYLEAKLRRHDRQFIEVNTDLREKYMSVI